MTAQDYLQKWIKETYPLMDSADYCELDYYDMQKFAVWIVKLLATPAGLKSLNDLDGKTIPVTFHVSKYKPKIDIDLEQ